MLRGCSAVLFFGFLLTLSACGGGAKPVPVSGSIMWDDGSPITGAMLQFMPKEKEGKTASGLSGQDGKFSLTTFNSGDGALIGDYTVIVTKTKVFGGGNEPTEKDPTKLFQKFAEKGKGLKPAAEKSEIPTVYSKVETSTLKWKVEGTTSDVKLTLQKIK
ncbi:MAG: hypothetical protein L0215_01775 [Gemmataceae bacterium]|nr:hypothetical protein [Gemmataceae bacterium]